MLFLKPYKLIAMRLRYPVLFKSLAFASIFSVFLTSCGNGDSENTDAVDSTMVKPENDKVGPLVVNGEIFSIPSPIQTSMLIKQVGTNYSKDILNPTANTPNYTTTFKKALNLGVFGADLGYVTIYEQTQDAIGYLNSVKKLADELGVSGAFDVQTIERFQKNLGNKDSLLVLVSVAYRASDAYLKNNERNDISGLVLAGGWIESLYFAVNTAKTSKSDELVRRIGEQKSSLNSVIKLLTPYYSQPEYAELVDELMALSTIFENVAFAYTYEKPVTDVKNKITTINSKTQVTVSPEQLESISQKIQSIRNLIVG